jgi:hypothetical protein
MPQRIGRRHQTPRRAVEVRPTLADAIHQIET